MQETRCDDEEHGENEMNEIITKNTIFERQDGQMILKPDAIETIREIEVQMKKLEKQYKKFKKALLEGMEEYGIKKVDSEDLLITYIEPSERVTIDTKMLWDKYKEVAFDCQKVSEVNGSIRITVR